MSAKDADTRSADLMNSSVHAAGPPHTLFQRLREECPIKRVRSGQTEYWSDMRLTK